MFFLKNFFNSTILGLAFGVFLAAYAVFAYTPPSALPPGDNVPAPLNTGPDWQGKQGDLWVRALGVDGGATFLGGATFGGGVQAQSICLKNSAVCLKQLNQTNEFNELKDRIANLEQSLPGSSIFNQSGTFTVPAWVSEVTVSVVAGGGGGGGGDSQDSYIPDYTIPSTDGASGGSSSFGSYVLATGGGGGQDFNSGGSAGSPGGSAGSNSITTRELGVVCPYIGGAGGVGYNGFGLNNIGGGGKGGDAVDNCGSGRGEYAGGGGGSGGRIISQIVRVSPGEQISVTVGEGGQGGAERLFITYRIGLNEYMSGLPGENGRKGIVVVAWEPGQVK